ncbi:hypothetical protein CMO88_02355 [Candidatus Woesearchaeota archaeon]|nr:hypothetical protein [Candidatus Woesearchaeota archaeon]|tara:strand:+ start:4607 stop:5560 length:954 start_codon:yes stop_codon:yes gene_type:complete
MAEATKFQQHKFGSNDQQRELNEELFRRMGISDLEGRTVVEFGLGNGAAAHHLFNWADSRPKTFIGIEFNPERLDAAVEYLEQQGINALIVEKNYRKQFFELELFAEGFPPGVWIAQGNVEDLYWLPHSSVDIITMPHMLHLVSSQTNAISEARRILTSKGGKLGSVSMYGAKFEVPEVNDFYNAWTRPLGRYFVSKIKSGDLERGDKVSGPIVDDAGVIQELANGFEPIGDKFIEYMEAAFPREYFESIARDDKDFPEGVANGLGINNLPEGIREELSDLLVEAVEPAMKGREVIPRNVQYITAEITPEFSSSLAS